MRVGPTMPQGNSRRSWRMTQTPNRAQQGQPGSQGCAGAGGAVSARADEHSPRDQVCNHLSKCILS